MFNQPESGHFPFAITMPSQRFGFYLAHFNILAVLGVLVGALVVQFGLGEFPCPLCMLQRMGMLLCVLGPAYILACSYRGDVATDDFTMGYGLSILGALGGGAIAARQILLHIQPGDSGYGSPVFGLHLYTWAFIVFVVVIAMSAVNIVLSSQLTPRGVRPNWLTRAVLGSLILVILANLLSVLALEGLHWVLPDNPDRYQLFEDLGWAQ